MITRTKPTYIIVPVLRRGYVYYQPNLFGRDVEIFISQSEPYEFICLNNCVTSTMITYAS